MISGFWRHKGSRRILRAWGMGVLFLSGSVLEVHAKNYLSHVQEGTAFLDNTGNGQLDDEEVGVSTGPNGRFRLFGSTGRLYLKGGIDIQTGFPNKQLLTAPKGSSSIGVLTTIWQALKDRRQPHRKIMKMLGLRTSMTPANFVAKPIERLKAGSRTILLLQRDAQQHNLLRELNALKQANSSEDVQLKFPLIALNPLTSLPEDAVAGAFADALVDEMAPRRKAWKAVDLANPDTVKRILASALARLSVPLPADTDLNLTAQAVSELNALVGKTGRTNPALFNALSSRGAAQARLVADGLYSDLANTALGLTPAFTTVTEDTGSSPEDHITRDRQPTIKGVVAPDATKVTVDLGDGPADAILEAGGSWSYAPPAALEDGSFSCTAVAYGVGGEQSPPSAPLTLTIDTLPPPAATVDDLATSDTTPKLSGTWEPAGNELTVTVNGRTYGKPLLKTGETIWFLELPAEHALPLGTYDVTTVITDLAGNSSEFTGNGVLQIESPLAHLFIAGTPIALDSKPYLVTLADFNNDGKLDFAATGDSHRVSLLLGNGDGSFQPAIESPAFDGTPMTMHVGKINDDDYLDIQIFDSPSLLLGNGDGSLQPPARYDFFPSLDAIKLADLNGDGRLDIVASQISGIPIAVLVNDGHGQFSQRVNYATGDQESRALAIADFDGDQRPDIAVTSGTFGNSVAILRNNGDSSFGEPVRFVTGDFPWGIDTGDLNADGRPDLVVANWSTGTISILLNQEVGKPAFQ